MIPKRSMGDVLASDPEILVRIASGEVSALGELYDRYQGPVRRFLVQATSNSPEVDDLLHNTFLTAAQCASRYDGRDVCRPWLIGIATQLVRRRRSALGRWFAVLTSLGVLRATSLGAHGAVDARTDLERGLSRLSEAKRTALILAEVEGLSCPEIARLLEIPVGTVWTRLHAARRELRQFLDEGGQP